MREVPLYTRTRTSPTRSARCFGQASTPSKATIYYMNCETDLIERVLSQLTSDLIETIHSLPGLHQDPNDPYTKREMKYDASGGPAEFEKYREHIQRCTPPPHPGGNPGANLESISHICRPSLVECVWELTE